ncbi:MAG: M20/M25/M40 family metallo-hydrolase [Burkholderiales bacterium]|nr:M20/M25/M40 family metallo-hydrolase [Burkholderiales bacterium]
MAASKPVWLTIGDSAFAELQKLQPGTKAIASHSINNNQLATMAKPERVHLVQVDEEFLPTLSEALHHARRRCGGYAAYASLQQAKAALQSDAPLATFRTTRPSYLIQNEEVVEANLQQMRAANITAMISQLSTQFRTRYFSAEEGAEAADWLYRTWGKMAVARPDITVEKFKHSGWPQESVILTIAGSDNAREVVVLGAHLDSINTEKKNATDGEMERAHAPGADDDASGVAGITEALRALIHTGYKPRRTLKFIAYAAEEVGLRGSAEIAADFFAHKVNVVGALQLDMTNFKPDIKGIKDIYLISDYTDGQQNKFLKELIATYQPTLTVGQLKIHYD